MPDVNAPEYPLLNNLRPEDSQFIEAIKYICENPVLTHQGVIVVLKALKRSNKKDEFKYTWLYNLQSHCQAFLTLEDKPNDVMITLKNLPTGQVTKKFLFSINFESFSKGYDRNTVVPHIPEHITLFKSKEGKPVTQKKMEEKKLRNSNSPG